MKCEIAEIVLYFDCGNYECETGVHCTGVIMTVVVINQNVCRYNDDNDELMVT